MVLNKKDRDLCLCGVAHLILVVSVGLLIYRFHYKKQINIEGFTTNNIINHNSGIYDKFYSRIYDKIFTDIKKTSLELTNVIEHTIK